MAKSKHPAPPDAADPTDGVERSLPGAGQRLEAGHLAPQLGDGNPDALTAAEVRQRHRELARAMSRDLVKDGDREGELVEGSPPELLMALDRALAQPPQDVPRMELARSLEEAGPRTFVYIDNQGRVRSPVQYRLMQVFSYSMLAAILVGGTALYASLLGPQGLLFGVMFSALVGRNLRLTRQINQAALLSSHDRLDEAEVLLVSNPVFGLDFTAVAEVHARLRAAREAGTAVLMVSEDLDELLQLADRIVVMSGGRLVHECAAAGAERHELGRFMGGHGGHGEQGGGKERQFHAEQSTLVASVLQAQRT